LSTRWLEAAKHARANDIVLFTDQQRWDTTGVHGSPLDLTPNCRHPARPVIEPATTSR
jgi:hypothetical protein